MNPLVSVIMPAYNMEKYISQSIDSVLNQDYQNWELLIVDDGSIDETLSICLDYVGKDVRIKCYHKENGGLPSARNFAIERAQGSILALLDSDDLWLRTKLSVSVREFLKGDQDLLFTNGYNFTDDSELTNIHILKKFPLHKGEFYGKDGLREFIKGNKVHVPTVLVKRSVILELNGFPSFNFAEDYCLWLLLLLNGYKLRGIENALSLYRERPDSMLHSEKRSITKSFKIFEFLIDNFPEFGKHQVQLINWIFLYVILEYDRDNIHQFYHIMKILNFKNRWIDLVIKCNVLLPVKIEKKLLGLIIRHYG